MNAWRMGLDITEYYRPRISKGRRVLKFGPGKSQELLNRAADPKTFFWPFLTILGARKKICRKWLQKNPGPSPEGQSIVIRGQKNDPRNFLKKLNKGHF